MSLSLNESERAVLSILLRWPNTEDGIVARVCSELTSDKFGAPEHKIIYGAIQNLAIKGMIPLIPSVAQEIGEDLEAVGGVEYLHHMKGLTSKPKVGMKVKVAPQELENGNLAYFIKPA